MIPLWNSSICLFKDSVDNNLPQNSQLFLWTLLQWVFKRNSVSNISLQILHTNDVLSSAILKLKLMLLFVEWKIRKRPVLGKHLTNLLCPLYNYQNNDKSSNKACCTTFVYVCNNNSCIFYNISFFLMNCLRVSQTLLTQAVHELLQ